WRTRNRLGGTWHTATLAENSHVRSEHCRTRGDPGDSIEQSIDTTTWCSGPHRIGGNLRAGSLARGLQCKRILECQSVHELLERRELEFGRKHRVHTLRQGRARIRLLGDDRSGKRLRARNAIQRDYLQRRRWRIRLERKRRAARLADDWSDHCQQRYRQQC